MNKRRSVSIALALVFLLNLPPNAVNRVNVRAETASEEPTDSQDVIEMIQESVDTPEPTAAPEPTQEPVPEPDPQPVSEPAPTAEPTAIPTPEPTVEPTAEPTPIVEPTAEPTVEPTPTGEPTAEPTPTVEPTTESTPTVEPTVEPTAEPAPTVTPTVEPTAEPTPTVEPTAEPTQGPTVEPTPTIEPTLEPTAEPTATPEPLVIQLAMDVQYAIAGEKSIAAHVEIAEASQEIACTWRVVKDGVVIAEQTAAEIYFSYLPTAAGEYQIIVIVADAFGQSVSKETSVAVIDASEVLCVQLLPSAQLAIAGMKPIAAHAEITGGKGNLSVAYHLWLDGALICEAADQLDFSYLADTSGNYTLTVTAADEIGQRAENSIEIIVQPTPEPVVLNLIHSTYGYVDEKAIDVQTEITGGMPEYAILYQVYAEDGTLLSEYEGSEMSWSYAPEKYGLHTVVVTVTDGAGQTSTAQVEIPVAEKDLRNPADWFDRAQAVKLTGDWRKDIIAIAESQLGYRESETDFIIDEDGKKQGYSIYGDLYGLDYVDWCAMFVSACLRFAGISEADYPVSSSCERMKNAIASMGAYEPVQNDEVSDEYDGYMPAPGDLVFFWREEYPKYEAHHIGIVTEVEDGVVKTIEGNTSRSVARKEYALTDERIIGYANTAKMMILADAYPTEELSVEIQIGNMTAQPMLLTTESLEDNEVSIDFAVADGGLAFQYHTLRQQTWNPDTHTYDTVESSEWSLAENGGNEVLVTNTSAVPVTVTVSANVSETNSGIQVTVNGETASSRTIKVDDRETFVIGIAGSFSTDVSDVASVIGTIQIELSAAE